MPNPPKTSPNGSQILHPTLRAALGSLDVQLEDELALYRRQRRTVPAMAASRIAQKTPPPPLEVVHLNFPEAVAPALGASPGLSVEELDSKALPPAIAQENLALETLSKNPSPEPIPGTVTPQLAAGSPENYLESSEQLLKSLTEETPEKTSEEPEENEPPSFADNLLTPLGLGSMLLLLLSSASLGYLLMNPAIAQRLGLSRLIPGAAPVASQSPPSPIASASSPTNSPSLSPNLANNGSDNLDKNNIVNLKPGDTTPRSPIPSVSTPPSPAATITPKTNPAIINGSPDLAGQLGIPPVATPLPTPPSPAATANPKPSPAASPAPSNRRRDTYLYVIVAYDGDRSLSQARAVIPEAYLAEIPSQGTKIHMGAFLNEADANALIQELKQRGIAGTIYQPN